MEVDSKATSLGEGKEQASVDGTGDALEVATCKMVASCGRSTTAGEDDGPGGKKATERHTLDSPHTLEERASP